MQRSVQQAAVLACAVRAAGASARATRSLVNADASAAGVFSRWQSSSASGQSSGGVAADAAAPSSDAAAGASSGSARAAIPTAAPPHLDSLAASKRRLGGSNITSLGANPYDWEPDARSIKQAPMWMLYEAEREETKNVHAGQQGRKKTVVDRAVLQMPMRDEEGRAHAVGRRKTSTARVWIKLGDGRITVNGKNFAEYFPRLQHRRDLIEPYVATQACGAFDTDVIVSGGGLTGQAGAIKHGIGKALARYDPELKPLIRQFGLLKRDPRMVERKKPGQPKARKKFQWVKR